MDKNQHQDIAQKINSSKAFINLYGENFEGPSYSLTGPTMRQAEHASARGTTRSLAERVLDETGVYKNLLQETAHRAGIKLPVYTTMRSGPGHQPIFASSVELAGMSFNGEPAKTKKQAEKNAAMAAWSALKEMPNLDSLQCKGSESGEEKEQAVVVQVLSNFKPKEESGPMNQRHVQQRRISPPQNASGIRHQGRLNNHLLDGSSIYKSQQQQRLQGSSLPPPTTKISPPLSLRPQSPSAREPTSSSRDNNSKYSFSCQLKESHKVGDGWTPESYNAKGKSIAKDHFLSKISQECSPRPPHQRGVPLSYPKTQPPYRPSMIRSPIAAPIPRTMGSGGFHGMAPAVTVRSVIPVCAAPPRMRPLTDTSDNQKKEAEDVSAATSKLNNLHLPNKTEL